jgi:hypothetical protein
MDLEVELVDLSKSMREFRNLELIKELKLIRFKSSTFKNKDPS